MESICQSCAMPMQTEDQMGTEADGTRNKEYCIYCYVDGQFSKPEETMDQAIESCIPFMKEDGISEDDARARLTAQFPQLKRWQVTN